MFAWPLKPNSIVFEQLYYALLLCFRDLSRFLIFYNDRIFCFVLNVDLRDFIVFSKSLIAPLTFSRCFIDFYKSS